MIYVNTNIFFDAFVVFSFHIFPPSFTYFYYYRLAFVTIRRNQARQSTGSLQHLRKCQKRSYFIQCTYTQRTDPYEKLRKALLENRRKHNILRRFFAFLPSRTENFVGSLIFYSVWYVQQSNKLKNMHDSIVLLCFYSLFLNKMKDKKMKKNTNFVHIFYEQKNLL